MSARTDKLILLVQTGSNIQVRRTAATQLAHAVTKAFNHAAAAPPPPVDPADTAAADIKPDITPTVVLGGTEHEAWSEVLETVSKLLHSLSSKHTDARVAAAHALGLLAAALPHASGSAPSRLPPLDRIAFPDVLDRPYLLASAGKEYAVKLLPADREQQRKAMMGSLGMGNGVDWGEEVDKIVDDGVDTEGLSARQKTMLKRKKGNVHEEANKMRKIASHSASASVASSPHGSPVKAETPLPGAPPTPTPAVATPLHTLTYDPTQSPWATIVAALIPLLTDASWYTRHGAAVGITELARHVPVHITLCRHLLLLLSLDRFGDFLGDRVMAPVREAAAQALGVCLKSLPLEDVREVHATLCEMVMQPWGRSAWELRHAGLLGLKYEVAVRPEAGVEFFDDILRACLSALQGQDDDVRSVAAEVLLPLSQSLGRDVIDILWQCLEDADELGSSVGAIMDLIGALVTHREYTGLPLARIYPFLRHPIVTVRRAVISVLGRLGKPDPTLIFENVLLELQPDIRQASFDLAEVDEDFATDWLELVMTPIGRPLDIVRKRRGHDVDKAMVEGDTSLVDEESMWATRIDAARILARATDLPLALASQSAYKIIMSCIILQESGAARHQDALVALLESPPTFSEVSSLKPAGDERAAMGQIAFTQERLSTRVAAAVAAALVGMGHIPAKHGSVIRALMNAIKTEDSAILQARASGALAAFIAFVQSPKWQRPAINAPEKVVQNLFKCLGPPPFSADEDGIEPEAKDEESVARRGAIAAFAALREQFGETLWESVPAMRQGFTVGEQQRAVEALTAIRLVGDARSVESVIQCLPDRYRCVRHAAARALASLAGEPGVMRLVVDRVIPLVGDARLHARQGAVDAIHYVIARGLEILPYVLFLIVPILGRMSDPDEDVRRVSTAAFASLLKMIPLEAGIADPPGFEDLVEQRDQERRFLAQLLEGKTEEYQLPVTINAELRQYQKDGVSWLAFLAKYQLHGILCDDMGLGKSLQTICIIAAQHHSSGASLPSLIVCPPTLVGHWHHEIQKFSSLRPLQYVGSSRAALRPVFGKYDIVITSYETVRADIDYLSTIDWLYCALDEGHVIKNAKTKLAQAVKQLRARHRLILSGTPIQNNLVELWSLFDFLMPGFLGADRVFHERYVKPVMADREGKASPKEREAAATALESLHKQVLPFLLRRLKEDVLADLPPKIIQDYYCDLSPLQAVLYDEFAKSRAADEAGQDVESGGSAGTEHVFQSLQYLRKLCNHPALVLDEARLGEVSRKQGLKVGLRDVENAPKLVALKQLLNDCGIGIPAADKLESGAGHRVLIFCQLRSMLDLIETTLFSTMPVSYMRMDGATDPKKRHDVVQTFNADANIDVLLLTTSVGGLGLNLTSADTVIFVDHDWNPMKDLQAMDRAHRIGQRKVVNVYRLIMRGTLEEKIMGLQRFKLNIASSVVTQQNASLGSMNNGDVLDLFKVGEEGEGKRAKKETGSMSMSKVLEGLDDLPPEDEYAELSLDHFMSKM